MEKLLVLDDESLILTSLEHLFEDDYDVFTTSDAETALALARAHDLAVILCDERMPGVSGHEFLRRVREVSRATRLMISGYADITALTEAVNSGQIFAYVSKPWDPMALKATVKAAVTHFKLVQEVDQERELLRALMENVPDLIYFKDCQSRFTKVNRAQAHEAVEGCIGCTASFLAAAVCPGSWCTGAAGVRRSSGCAGAHRGWRRRILEHRYGNHHS